MNDPDPAERWSRAIGSATLARRRLVGTYERMAEVLEETARLADEHAVRKAAGGNEPESERREAAQAREHARRCRALARRWA